MKSFLFRFRFRFAFLAILGVGFAAYATLKKDPLEKKYEEVEKVVFGNGGGSEGLFSWDGETKDAPTIPLRNNPAYIDAQKKVFELKEMIERETVRRKDDSEQSEKFQTLLDVCSKYIEIQKIFHLNYLANLHEGKVRQGEFQVDNLNLKLNSRVGFQFILKKEFQQKFHVRHSKNDPNPGQVELFIPPYERTQLEATALGRVKSKLNYQKLLHLSHLRDGLVNRWALKRVVPSMIHEGLSAPPRGYDSFSGETVNRPSSFAFFRDLEVEDRYQTRIKDPLQELRKALQNMPLASEPEYRDLVREYFDAFSQFDHFQFDPAPMVANLFDLEERALEDTSEALILEANFPQDELTSAGIAERTARSAFQVRKSGILKALLQKAKLELAIWNLYVEPDEDGMVSQEAFTEAARFFKIPESDIVRAAKVVDSRLRRWEESWRVRMREKIKALYRDRILPAEKTAARKRYESFFRQTLKSAAPGMFYLKQLEHYDAVRNQIGKITESDLNSLNHQTIPLTVECAASGAAVGVISSSCVTRVRADYYLSGLDASADMGMSWVIPWTSEQIRTLLQEKIRLLKEENPTKFEEIKDVVQDPGIEYFFNELKKREEKLILAKKLDLQSEKQKISEKLAVFLERNPGAVMEETALYREMSQLQERIESVGIDHRESVLTGEMYESAALTAIANRIDDLYRKIPDALKELEKDRGQESSKEFKVRATIMAPDALTVNLTGKKDAENRMRLVVTNRRNTMIALGKAFTLLGFHKTLLAPFWSKIGVVVSDYRGSGAVSHLETTFPKPDANTRKIFGDLIRNDPREARGDALSEITRSAWSQRTLAESAVEKIYLQAPFLRIREGDDLMAPTGLERLSKAFSPVGGWNQPQARAIFDSLIQTAVRNDAGKVENAILARPDLPGEDPGFKKIFKAQATQRALLQASFFGQKKEELGQWEEELRLETRTTSEVWNDRFISFSQWMMVPILVFLLWELMPVLVPAFGFSFSTASAVFSGFAGGPILLGALNGSNFLVQLFFISTVATQGHVAFFTLPAQMQYEREIANSTVGLSGSSERIALPSERVSTEQLALKAEEVESARMMTGVGAAVQLVFLPMQVKSFLRWSGVSGRVALHSLGRASPEMAQAVEAPSLESLIRQHGYSKGSRLYLDRYRAAVLKGKPVSAVNGAAQLSDAQKMLANALGVKLSNSSELAAFLEARIAHIGTEEAAVLEEARNHFQVVRGSKVRTVEEAVRLQIGAALAKIKFRLQRPAFRIGIRKSFKQAVLRGMNQEMAQGTENHLLRAFILLKEAESLMQEAAFLRWQVARIRELEASAGGAVGTTELFLDFTRLQNLRNLDDLLEWGVRQSKYGGTSFGRLLEDARKSSKDFKIIAEDIQNLSPRDREILGGRNGEVDVIIGEDFQLHAAPAKGFSGEEVDFYIVPGSYIQSK